MCGPAACWSPPLFLLTPVSQEHTPHCRHMADMPVAHCCGTDDIRHYRRGRHGAQCREASATQAAMMSGWRVTPRCEELKGHLEREMTGGQEGIQTENTCFSLPVINHVIGHTKCNINQIQISLSIKIKLLLHTWMQSNFIMVSISGGENIIYVFNKWCWLMAYIWIFFIIIIAPAF